MGGGSLLFEAGESSPAEVSLFCETPHENIIPLLFAAARVAG